MGDKKDVSNRFIEAYEMLLKDGIVSNKKDFATNVGVSPSMITEISKGRSSVGTSAIQNIVLIYNISPEWLLTGRGEMLKVNEERVAEAKKTSSRHKGIPLIPMEAIAGLPADDNEGVYMEDCQRYSIPEFEA